MDLLLLVMLTVSVMATSETRGGTGKRYCGWELMQNLRMSIHHLCVSPSTNLTSPQRFPYSDSVTGTQSKPVIALYVYFRTMVRSTALVSMNVETVSGDLLKRADKTTGGMEIIAAHGSGNQDVKSTAMLGYVMGRVDGAELKVGPKSSCREAIEGYV
jgi:hypothetical protein